MNGDTYEKVDENFTSLQDNVNALTEEKVNLETEKETFSQKIEEHESTIATLQQEKASVENELNDVKGNFENAQSTIQTLTEENEALAAFKNAVLLKEKEAVIEHYSTLLDAEVIEPFKAKIDEMTKEELDKELAYVLVQSQPTLFTRNENDPGRVPKNEPALTGIEGILTRYKNK